jgi:hypothetical protein
MEVNHFGEDNSRSAQRATRSTVVSRVEPTGPMPSVSMGLVLRLRSQQEENRPGQVSVFPLPGANTVRDGESERTLWNFRRNDLAGTLEIPREHGLSRQASRIQSLRSTLYGIREIIDDAERAHCFGPKEAQEIRDRISQALDQNEPWIESVDMPEWANNPLPKSWGVSE